MLRMPSLQPTLSTPHPTLSPGSTPSAPRPLPWPRLRPLAHVLQLLPSRWDRWHGGPDHPRVLADAVRRGQPLRHHHPHLWRSRGYLSPHSLDGHDFCHCKGTCPIAPLRNTRLLSLLPLASVIGYRTEPRLSATLLPVATLSSTTDSRFRMPT